MKRKIGLLLSGKLYAAACMALLLLLASCGNPVTQAPLTTIEGEWAGSLTSTVYGETVSVTVSVGPQSETTDSHRAVFDGYGTSLDRTVYCQSDDLVDMECYRFGTSSTWSILMEGRIAGRAWTGNFSFSDPLYGPDRGTFRFTKR